MAKKNTFLWRGHISKVENEGKAWVSGDVVGELCSRPRTWRLQRPWGWDELGVVGGARLGVEGKAGGPRAALGKKGSSGRGAGWAQSQALTRPLSHPPQPPQTPDMEAARPVWPGCREQQPKPRGSGLHFLPCPGGGTAAQTLHGAKNKEQEGMTDRPAPRPPARRQPHRPSAFPMAGPERARPRAFGSSGKIGDPCDWEGC